MKKKECEIKVNVVRKSREEEYHDAEDGGRKIENNVKQAKVARSCNRQTKLEEAVIEFVKKAETVKLQNSKRLNKNRRNF